MPQESAGGAVLRETGGEIYYLAIRPARSDRWQLPKGIVEKGERVQDAAVREVREEGGIEAEIVAALDPVTYFFRSGSRAFRKTVHFFAMRYLRGDPADHDREVEEALWIPAAAIDRLTFESERKVMREAISLLRQLDV